MPDRATCNWTGKSGTIYKYHIYELSETSQFDPTTTGNYIFARLNDKREWVAIYIGQGELKGRAADDHDGCITEKGATHFHCHTAHLEPTRLAEEQDLLANYTQAYKPTGCNEREGG